MEQVHEVELQAVAVAPRVTAQDLDANIKSADFFTAYQGALKAQYDLAAEEGLEPSFVSVDESLKLLTICVITLQNGFTVLGQSACASPENFNQDIGNRLAFEDAKNKIWAFMGYALKQDLFESLTHEEPHDLVGTGEAEARLEETLAKLEGED
jgi:hypothetical protein